MRGRIEIEMKKRGETKRKREVEETDRRVAKVERLSG